VNLSVVRFKLGLVLASGVLVLLFQNCSIEKGSQNQALVDPPSTPENFIWLETAVPEGLGSVNYFKASKPTDMSGLDGYRFLFQEYIQPKCVMCHRPPSGQFPHFGVTSATDSYYVAKPSFITYDIQYRVTRNPHCTTCNLDERGEVYQAIRYWLEHR